MQMIARSTSVAALMESLLETPKTPHLCGPHHQVLCGEPSNCRIFREMGDTFLRTGIASLHIILCRSFFSGFTKLPPISNDEVTCISH